MTLTCPRNSAHRVFERRVLVEGPTFATLDEHGDVLHYQDCRTFRLIRSTSDVRCAVCDTRPTISIVG
jgi:LSD1 subclass zinc finger protein